MNFAKFLRTPFLQNTSGGCFCRWIITIITIITIDQKPDDDENLSSGEETCFTREVTEAIHETLHKKKKRRAYQSRSVDIIPYKKKLKLRISDFLSNDNPKTLTFENTSASMNIWKIGILWMLNL